MTDRPAPPVLVLVLYNLPRRQGSNSAGFAEADQGVLAEVEAVRQSLARLGIAVHVAGIHRLADLPGLLGSRPERIVFNLVESLEGPAGDFNDVPAVCRSWGRRCTGSDSQALAASLDKWQSKALLAQAGLDVPAGALVPPGGKENPAAMPKGKCIVKPACADASEGITPESIVTTAAARHRAIARIHAMGQAALVEQYIDGRELNVSLMQRGGELTVLPLAEIDLSALPAGAKIVDYAAKWLSESDAYRQTPRLFPKLPAALKAKVVAAAKAAYHALGCRDYARVDFRLDGRGRPFVLEVNTNPDISPDAGFAAALAAGGVSFDQFVRAAVDNAAARAGQAATLAGAGAEPCLAGAQGQYTIRVSAAADRDAILDMLARTQFFRPDELEIAREVLDDSLADGPEGDYKSYTIADGSRPLGWVCWGATPCCLGTYDMYWIVVDPAVQSRGLGKMLVAHCERLVRAAGGRLLVIETSGRGEYLSTRRFYLRCGYFEAARVADFYAEGDDKVMYTKYLQDL